MKLKLRDTTYIDWKVYSVTKIKDKYGFRVKLIYDLETYDYDIQQKSGFKTKKEAEDNRNIVISQLVDHTYVVYPNIKVSEFFLYWLNEVMSETIAYNSYLSYRNVICNYIIKEYGTLKMTTLNQSHIQKIYKIVGLKYPSLLGILKPVLNNGLDYAKTRNIVSVNVARSVDLPKSVKQNKKIYKTFNIDSSKTLTIEQAKKLIEDSKGTPIYLQVLFGLLLGLRLSEINGLKYTDIDFINKRVQLETQLGTEFTIDKKTYKINTTTKKDVKLKTRGSKRWIDIPDILYDAIVEERRKYEKNRRRRINDKNTPFKDNEYICCSTYGRARGRCFHRKYFEPILKTNNFPITKFHELRHTYATLLINANFSSKAVATILGHASDIITIDVYCDKEKIIIDSLDKLEPYITEVKPIKNDSGIFNYSNVDLETYYQGLMQE